MSMSKADGARGAHVELALDAALNGNAARAIGIVAGMSLEERAEFGPLVGDALRSTGAWPGRTASDHTPLWLAAGAITADDLDTPQWVNEGARVVTTGQPAQDELRDQLAEQVDDLLAAQGANDPAFAKAVRLALAAATPGEIALLLAQLAAAATTAGQGAREGGVDAVATTATPLEAGAGARIDDGIIGTMAVSALSELARRTADGDQEARVSLIDAIARLTGAGRG